MDHSPKYTNSEYVILSSFEDIFGKRYTLGEKYFYVILRMSSHQYADTEGWFMYGDSVNKERGRSRGFDEFGFSRRVCKEARKKLKEDELIACTYRYGIKGSRTGTAYRLVDDKLTRSPKQLHEQILGGLSLPSGEGCSVSSPVSACA